MSLPNLPAGDKFRREVRREWGGINLNENAGDGELVEALNMSSREYPLIATEWDNPGYPVEQVRLAPFLQDGKLGYLRRTGTNTYVLFDPTPGGSTAAVSLSDADVDRLSYAGSRDKLYLFPSKQVYDFTAHTMRYMRNAVSGDAWFRSTTLDGVKYDANAISIEGAGASHLFDGFRPGDGVTIRGCTKHKANNRTAIIREISGDYLIFSENAFHLDNTWGREQDTLDAGEYWFRTDEAIVQFTVNAAITMKSTIYYTDGDNELDILVSGGPRMVFPVTLGVDEGTELTMTLNSENPYEETGISIAREIPDMDFVCMNENRMWGCRGDTIYASKLGDPLNWNVFDGLSTDSWSAETGTEGCFTGCCSFQGCPTFFKDDAVYKVFGDEPGNFVLRRQSIVGVAEGSNKSIVEIRGRLYYVSHIGVVEWNGGDDPSIVSHALGSLPGTMSCTLGTAPSPKAGKGAVAGTDGIRYFVHAYHTGYRYSWLPDGEYTKSWTTSDRLFVYDPRFGTWHERKVSAAGYRPDFTGDGTTYYMLEHTGDVVNNALVYQTVEHILSQPGVAGNNPDDAWRVLFPDSTRAYKTVLTGSEGKKGVLRLLIRCRLAGSMKIWISYDGGDFEEAGELGGEDGMAKSSRVVPLILRRCDYWQLRLTGTGDAVIYSIAVEKYGGEWQQA